MTAPGIKPIRENDDGFDVARLSSREIAAELNRRSLALREPPSAEQQRQDLREARLASEPATAPLAASFADAPAVSAPLAHTSGDPLANDMRAADLRVPEDSIRPAAVTAAVLAKTPRATMQSGKVTVPKRRSLAAAFVSGTIFGIILVALASAGALAVYLNPALLGSLHHVKARVGAMAPAAAGVPPIASTPAPAASAAPAVPIVAPPGNATSAGAIPLSPVPASTPLSNPGPTSATREGPVIAPAPVVAPPPVAAPPVALKPAAITPSPVLSSPVLSSPVPSSPPAVTPAPKPATATKALHLPADASTTAPAEITPSPAWLQRQPYDPAKAASPAAAKPSPAGGTDWMQAQPFDPAKATAP